MRELGYGDAISEALREEMARDENVFLIGEDLGSVHEADDLFAAFRERRVWQTPISEEAFTGLGVGAAMAGLRLMPCSHWTTWPRFGPRCPPIFVVVPSLP